MPNHAKRAHAILSASGASRWLACPPSARLEEDFPDKQTVYTLEGTLAHEIAECSLHCNPTLRVKGDGWKQWHEKMTKLAQTNPDNFNEIKDSLIPYTGLIEAKVIAARIKDKSAALILEKTFDLTRWAPESFGSVDVLIISNGTLEVIDLKYGKGVQVSAKNNSQMRMYALGALAAYEGLYDIQAVRTTICQPRISSELSSEELTVQELLEWGENTVKPAAQLAWDGKGEYKAGSHCRWCKAGAICKVRAEGNLALGKMGSKSPNLLSIDEIGEVLKKGKQLAEWVKTVEEWVFTEIKDNRLKVPGWKVVEGRSNRKITDIEAVCEVLYEENYASDEVYETKLKGITALEKIMGKSTFEALLGRFVIKPPGAPTLAPSEDPREEWRSAKSDFDGIPDIPEVQSSLLD